MCTQDLALTVSRLNGRNDDHAKLVQRTYHEILAKTIRQCKHFALRSELFWIVKLSGWISQDRSPNTRSIRRLLFWLRNSIMTRLYRDQKRFYFRGVNHAGKTLDRLLTWPVVVPIGSSCRFFSRPRRAASGRVEIQKRRIDHVPRRISGGDKRKIRHVRRRKRLRASGAARDPPSDPVPAKTVARTPSQRERVEIPVDRLSPGEFRVFRGVVGPPRSGRSERQTLGPVECG